MPRNVREIIDAYDAGQYLIRSWRKTPTVGATTGIWFDFSMSPGNPVPQYYAQAPLTATVLARSTDGGLDHGPNVSTAKKYLRKFMAFSLNTSYGPCPLMICDYLLFYPFVAMDVGTQDMINTNTLTRYTDGAGVRAMAVVVAPHVGGTSNFRVTYTNQNGVAGRVSSTLITNTQALNGSIITSSTTTGFAGRSGAFLDLQDGDTGMRSIEQVEFFNGDVGLIALVLVKPLASASIFDITAPVEVDYLIDQNIMPVIEDDAYLNIIGYPASSIATTAINGLIETVWI